VTRVGQVTRGPSLPELFSSDPQAAVISVLQQSVAASTAVEIKKMLEERGVERTDINKAWPGVQKRLRTHALVIAEGSGSNLTYRWSALQIPPLEALAEIAGGRLPRGRKESLVDIVRMALANSGDDLGVAERLQQAEMDAVRAVAELAIEAEELAASQASARAMIHRVRARAKLSRLEPIDRVGDEVTFDRRRHKSIGRPIDDGKSVIVVRPGYVWRARPEGVLIAKAVVQDRS
jgi:uncharacterized membrane protein